MDWVQRSLFPHPMCRRLVDSSTKRKKARRLAEAGLSKMCIQNVTVLFWKTKNHAVENLVISDLRGLWDDIFLNTGLAGKERPYLATERIMRQVQVFGFANAPWTQVLGSMFDFFHAINWRLDHVAQVEMEGDFGKNRAEDFDRCKWQDFVLVDEGGNW